MLEDCLALMGNISFYREQKRLEILGLEYFQMGKKSWPFIQNGENGRFPKSRSLIDHGVYDRSWVIFS